MIRSRSVAGVIAGALFAAVALEMVLATGTASAAPSNNQVIRLHRGGPDASVWFTTDQSAEALFDVTASAPDADWSVRGDDESAVVSVSVDGAYETDIVIPMAQPVVRHFVLGKLAAGRHKLALHFADDRSAPSVRTAVLSGLSFTTYAPGDDGYIAAKFTPVLYGRNLDQFGGPLDNAFSDTPLVAWHESAPAATPGHTLLQYSIIWSNEDGGTDTPALMARWGRTTDIEWIYRVEIDQDGNRVPGSDTYQAANHATTQFNGKYEDDHAVLDTCTSNNNICDVVNDPMRFFLSAQENLPAGQPREHVMDTNPWTYQVMAAEMKREGKLESEPDPSTAKVSDQRDYLFIAVKKDTIPPGNSTTPWVGLTVGVKLKGGRDGVPVRPPRHRRADRLVIAARRSRCDHGRAAGRYHAGRHRPDSRVPRGQRNDRSRLRRARHRRHARVLPRRRLPAAAVVPQLAGRRHAQHRNAVRRPMAQHLNSAGPDQ
jgi:hypothetical protein